MDINGMDVVIKKSWYQKTKVQEDGITHIVDTDNSYPVYQFGMAKNYFDIEDKEKVVDVIIEDLKGVITHLEQLKSQEKQKNNLEIERD